jgi:uncharacterized protein (TIGR00299 family) protein
MTPKETQAPRHIHLDVLGGIAGDMFIAAILDARPDLIAPCVSTMRAAGLTESWVVEANVATDTGMTGHRMQIEYTVNTDNHHDHDHTHSHHHYSDIQNQLKNSDLKGPVLDRALNLIQLIAKTEAQVHGVNVSNVALHEVGDLDSLADMVGAAFLIEALSPVTWSVGPLPIGGGFIQAAHGRMPVPAPATQLLLDGFSFIDDGIMGERITPTGAAILKHIDPSENLPAGRHISTGTGQGFGTRQLKGMANMLRVRFYEPSPNATQSSQQVCVLEFVIDDQTPEDLAIGLENLRAIPEVLEVIQIPAIAKKGRMGHIVQVITKLEAQNQVAKSCFLETTTLGLRWRIEARMVLDRTLVSTEQSIDVKLAKRPDGTISAKAEADDIAKAGAGHYERRQLRHWAETDAINKDTNDHS